MIKIVRSKLFLWLWLSVLLGSFSSLPAVSVATGVATQQKGRGQLNSRYAIFQHPDASFFGAFDGHCGEKAADFASKSLLVSLLSRIAPDMFSDETVMCAAIKEAVQEVEESFGILAQKHALRDGATALFTLMCDDMLYVGNIGDCRAVLSCKGKAKPLSTEHDTDRNDEYLRWEERGYTYQWCGQVLRTPGCDTYPSGFPFTRALGFVPYKTQYPGLLLTTPDIKVNHLKDGDEFLILASASLWRVLENQGAVDLVRGYLQQHPHDLHGAADLLRRSAQQTDNCTVIVIAFDHEDELINDFSLLGVDDKENLAVEDKEKDDKVKQNLALLRNLQSEHTQQGAHTQNGCCLL